MTVQEIPHSLLSFGMTRALADGVLPNKQKFTIFR